MSQHRRSLSRRRRITVTLVAAVALGTPTAAFASEGWHPGKTGSGHWQGGSSQWWAGHQHGTWPTTAPTTPAPAPSASAPAAPSTTAPSTTAPSGPTASVVTLVNAERKKAGCGPLTVNAKLTSAAQAHSQDMAAHKNMSHTGSDGSSPGDRITKAGYSWSAYGENVAYGYSTPDSVMAAWMSSPGHKANILDCSFKEIGVGLAEPGDYWTQDFGTAR
ncbi:CAP domain-containing protein [Peterkaempfera sp. SMS 1(5)a]|uniref:CAP domain-containing protein n=1 Tax=Peterkaempfera podocarpi TaxID=3232308 RepID=UPI003672F0B8